ncbi:MAG: ComEC/Rec2 family competence protein [Oscillospiraceae bacterium]|nr:ComEC/Rec2 family competence protein [Oscillospiraceae bacterium]MBR7084385.1 ComEC/Rec2 family competence protein [Oscillospiraceae bacterium]
MKRPALYIGLPYIIGLLIASKLDILSWSVILLTAVGVILYRRSVWKYVVLSTLSCLIACCSYWHHTALTEEVQRNFIGQEILFTGQITEKTAYTSGNADYLLKGKINGSISANIELFIDDTSFNYGDSLTISGKPEKITSNYLFDGAGYSKAKNLFLCIEKETEPEILEVKPLERQTLFSIVYNWRMRMTKRIQAHMPEDTGAMLTGMLFGEKANLKHSVKTSLYRAGIGHTLAISGLHLDFLAMCANWILEKLKAGRKTKFCFIGLACGLFVICAGETVSVKRACIMILLSQSAKLFYRKADAFNSLAIAMLLLGAENPFVIHSPAFWLSCTGAFGIGVAGQYMIKELPEKEFYHILLKDFIAFTWTFFIILPVSALYFNEFSIISPFTNLFLTPICLIAMLMGASAICFGCEGVIAEFFLSVADKLNQIILEISNFLAGLKWTHVSTESEILIILIGAGVIFGILIQVCLKSRKMTTIFVLIALSVTGIALNFERISQAENLKIAVLGDETNCLLAVCKNEEAILFDMTGNYYAPNYAEAYLEKSGIAHVEGLYLANPKEKSLKRYAEYLRFMTPEELWMLKKPKQAIFTEQKLYYAEQKEILFHGAKIEAEQNLIKIFYADKIYICKKEKTEMQETPDILTIYGTSQGIQPDCGLLFILDENKLYFSDTHTYIAENNLEVTIAENGKCRVRRLYAIDR